MSNQTLQNLGDAIFGDIDNNPFLNELYDNILYNYAITKFNLTEKRQMREVDVVSALRFADLLSKSTHAVNRDKHKMWAQEIIILLYSLYPDNPDVRFYAGSVFANTGNYQARKIIESDFYGTTALERFFAEYQNDYLTIPAAPELRFFGAQKNAYDHLSDDHFSYSGPTSMGKSFLMRMYIKDQIQRGVKMNFALIVPTKALINEIYKQVIDEDLKNLLSEHNYKVVTAAGDIALEGKHNFILVLTPERLLYLLISKPDLQIDYLFIDEAHKLSGKNSRGPFYYKTVDMLLKRKKKPHFVFASPNIPNPEVYLKSHFGKEYDEALEQFVLEHPERVCQFASLDDNNISQQARDFKQLSIQNPDCVMFLDRGAEEKPYYVRNGKLILFASDRLMEIDGRLTFSQPISDIWDDVLPNDIHNEGGVELKKGKKPEKLIARILELCTDEGDLVIDFFAGSGTTGAVAMKMHRRFILCEQMDYIETITRQRIINTMMGDTRGVSVNYGWQGGGSFVYCELAKLNQTVVEEIEAAADDETLTAIYEKMISSGFISYKVNPASIAAAADDFAALSLDDKKRFLMEILDKNLLYVNYCDMDDEEFGISDADKAFTRSFYREG